MTVNELYERSDQFRALIASWVSERRCPLPLVDLCLENQLESAAEACRWAATEPDQLPPAPFTHSGELSTECGPYPTLCEVGWIWHTIDDERRCYSSAVRHKWVGRQLFATDGRSTCAAFNTPTEAILHLLSVWISSDTSDSTLIT